MSDTTAEVTEAMIRAGGDEFYARINGADEMTGGLLGSEVAFLLISGLAGLFFSGCALNEAGKPRSTKSEIGYFAASVLFGGLGAICILLAFAA